MKPGHFDCIDKEKSRRLYSDHYRTKGAARKYERKFSDSIEGVRHTEEIRILNHYTSGAVLDCSVATGRFVSELTQVDYLVGMDYSEELLNWCAQQHPQIPLVRCDLLGGLPFKSEVFDVVICLRTLSSLGDVSSVIGEMARVTRSGGRFLFDYGKKAREVFIKGEKYYTDVCRIEDVLSKLSVENIQRIKCDGLLTWIKRSNRRKRLFDKSLAKIMGHRSLAFLERLSIQVLSDRVIFIVTR